MKTARLRYLRNRGIQSGIVIGAVSAATLLSELFKRTGFSETNIVIVYILSVLIVAKLTTGYFWGILASVLGMFSFNFFFTKPYHTFNVYNKNYLVTFSVMLAASLLTSTLTSKIIRSSKEAIRKERQTNILYQITSSLAKASSVDDVAVISVRNLSNLLNCDVAYIMADSSGRFCRKYSIKRGGRQIKITDIDGSEDSFLQRSSLWPIADQKHQYGLVCLPNNLPFTENNEGGLLSSACTQIFTAMERERLFHEKRLARYEADREKFKSTLLRSISHDLRTPLAGIAGAAEVLAYSLDDGDSKKLAQGICDDANWLTRMIENILSLTKIEEGKLCIKKQPEAVEEIVGEAVERAAKYAGPRTISVDIPNHVLFVPMDGKLIEQVLINLLDNAVKHTKPSDPILVSVRPENGRAYFSVRDGGAGLKPEEIRKIFEPFYSDGKTGAGSERGIGLGLSICRAIVAAHGGEISAENNPDKGLTVRFYLPLEEKK